MKMGAWKEGGGGWTEDKNERRGDLQRDEKTSTPEQILRQDKKKEKTNLRQKRRRQRLQKNWELRQKRRMKRQAERERARSE